MLKKIFTLFLLILITQVLKSQDTVYLDINQAIEMAMEQNQLIKIFEHKIENADAKLSEMKSNFYPRIIAEGVFAYNSDPNISATKGEFNHLYTDFIKDEELRKFLMEYLPLPPKDMTLIKGKEYFYKTNVSVYQPLSQLTTINTGKKIADIDLKISNLEYKDVVSKITLGINELFYGILIEEKNVEVARLNLEYSVAEYNDANNAYDSGEVLLIAVMALKAEIYEKEQELLEAQNTLESYRYSFMQLIGLELNTFPVLLLDEINLETYNEVEEYYNQAYENNYELGISNSTKDKAILGITAAKKAYIPELTYFAQYNYNQGIPLYPDNYLITGLNLKWTIFAAGERSSIIKQRNALFNQANENYAYKIKQLKSDVHKAYLNLVYAKKLIQTAEKALEARTEQVILTKNALDEGQILPSLMIEAKADFAKSEADLLASKLNYLIQIAKLDKLIGGE